MKRELSNTKNMTDEELIEWAMERAKLDFTSYAIISCVILTSTAIIYFLLTN